jgi:hypothetical protein
MFLALLYMIGLIKYTFEILKTEKTFSRVALSGLAKHIVSLH